MPAGLCTAGTGDALWPENAHATKLREPAHTAETGTPQPGRIAGCEPMDIVPVVGCRETYDARGEEQRNEPMSQHAQVWQDSALVPVEEVCINPQLRR